MAEALPNMEQILTDFIELKIKSYKDGVTTFNLSRRQYLAALLMLTNKKFKDIAKEIGVSYGTVRNWNTEEDFKEEIFSLCQDFVKFFEDRIKSIIKADEEQLKKAKKGKKTTNIKKISGVFASPEQTKKALIRNLFGLAFKAKTIRKITSSKEESIKRGGDVKSVRQSLELEAIRYLREPSMNEKKRQDTILILSYILALE